MKNKNFDDNQEKFSKRDKKAIKKGGDKESIRQKRKQKQRKRTFT